MLRLPVEPVASVRSSKKKKNLALRVPETLPCSRAAHSKQFAISDLIRAYSCIVADTNEQTTGNTNIAPATWLK
jgi:hypothetical protein